MLPALYKTGDYPYDVPKELQKIEVVSTPEEATDLVDRLYDLGGLPVAVDTESDDVSPGEESPAGKGIVITTQFAWVEDDVEAEELLELIENKSVSVKRVWVDCRDHRVLDLLKDWLEDENCRKVLHNFSWDCHQFQNHGIILRGLEADTLQLSRMEYPERLSHSLDGAQGLVKVLLGETRLTTKQALGVNKISESTGKELKSTEYIGMEAYVTDEEMRPFQQIYSCFDVHDTILIYYILKDRLQGMEWEEDENGFYGCWESFTGPYLPVLYGMERTGICEDTETARELKEKYEGVRLDLTNQIYAWAGCQVNLNSPVQKAWLLFGDGEKVFKDTVSKKEVTIVGKSLPIDPKRKPSKSGGLSTDKKSLMFILENLDPDNYPEDVENRVAVEALLERSKIEKLISGTLNPLVKGARPRHMSGVRAYDESKSYYNYVHPSFSVKARTGRLSSSSPNAQNVPSRTKEGQAIRHVFTCEDDEVILCCDYSQLELRILAAYILLLFDDDSMAKALESGDLHQATADDVGVDRKTAKIVNFGLIYGMTEYKLASDLRISVEAARDILNLYFKKKPSVKKYIDWAISYAKKHGCARTILGRYRQLPDINNPNRKFRGQDERRSSNTPIQGSAQDIVQLAMLSLDQDEELKKYGFVMRLQVHDEVVATCKMEYREPALKRMIHLMENAIEPERIGGVRFPVDGHWGTTWGEAKEGGLFTCPACGGDGCEACKKEGALSVEATQCLTN